MGTACPKCGSKDVYAVTVVLKRGKAKVKISKDVPRKLGILVICHTCGEKSTI